MLCITNLGQNSNLDICPEPRALLSIVRGMFRMHRHMPPHDGRRFGEKEACYLAVHRQKQFYHSEIKMSTLDMLPAARCWFYYFQLYLLPLLVVNWCKYRFLQVNHVHSRTWTLDPCLGRAWRVVSPLQLWCALPQVGH